MEETVEKIIKEAMERVKNYTLSDQHWILTEVSDRLRNNADECLQMEYFNVNIDDYESTDKAGGAGFTELQAGQRTGCKQRAYLWVLSW